MKLILIGLNEINFEYVNYYVRNGRLENFAHILKQHGYYETISEVKYEDIEPWIQWVTIHTGKTLSEHGVYRLGDIIGSDNVQIFEKLENKGLKVGAISPMNTENRLRSPAFFAPDPWTKTKTTGPIVLRWLVDAISQAVNKNAQSVITLRSKLELIAGFIYFCRVSSFKAYFEYLRNIKKKPWYKPFILDRLLSDVFISLWKRNEPDFSYLFLNAGAHIQHHYLYNSRAYTGSERNPDWYVKSEDDPVLEIYDMYDKILGELLQIDNQTRILVATGLHQDPHGKLTYYYRLKDHEKFLTKIGVQYKNVIPLMSRDFTIELDSKEQATEGEKLLSRIKDSNGEKLFYVDNRGSSLFVMLTYPHEINSNFKLYADDKKFSNFSEDVVFVAIKNGQHNNIGYFVDCGELNKKNVIRIPLKEVHQRILELATN